VWSTTCTLRAFVVTICFNFVNASPGSKVAACLKVGLTVKAADGGKVIDEVGVLGA
jgi:hypothetical protein